MIMRILCSGGFSTQTTIPATAEELEASMEDAKKYMEQVVTPKTPKNRIRRMNTGKTLEVETVSGSRSSKKVREENADESEAQPQPKKPCTAAKSKAKPKQAPKAKAPVPKKRPQLKKNGSKAVCKKHLKKKGKAQISGRSKETPGEAKTTNCKTAKGDPGKAVAVKTKVSGSAKAKVEPKSPRTVKAAKEVLSCLKRADTKDIKGGTKKTKTPAKGSKEIKEKRPEKEPEEDDDEEKQMAESSADEDERLERQLRLKRDQHARYMRFSRSLKRL